MSNTETIVMLREVYRIRNTPEKHRQRVKVLEWRDRSLCNKLESTQRRDATRHHYDPEERTEFLYRLQYPKRTSKSLLNI
jgi:hypothetical protein